MLFLANENIPLASVDCLRRAGYSVTAIVEETPGISDRMVLARAASENSVFAYFCS
jgi:hypothetical protein